MVDIIIVIMVTVMMAVTVWWDVMVYAVDSDGSGGGVAMITMTSHIRTVLSREDGIVE